MVSLWPWKGEDTSPAVFEKTLSALAEKISTSQLQLDSLRQSSRRVKALWTLYTSLAYVVCAAILGLVVGVKNWNIMEYTTLSGSPVIIYLVRRVISFYYTYRIDTVSRKLDEQQTERTKTIEKLKAATKYNSTQQLLEKYGASPPSPKPKPSPNEKNTPKNGGQVTPRRTGMGPPATANIPRNQPSSSQPSTPANKMNQSSPIAGSPRLHPANQPEFAPNAFPPAPRLQRTSTSTNTSVATEGKWYDRILDLLLGDDETNPKNRIVLICSNCRLVNGQAPPGVKSLREVGRWRCAQCGAPNGEVDEGQKIVAEIKEKMAEEELTSEVVEKSGGDDDVEEDVVKVDSANVDEGVKKRRGRPKKDSK